MEKLVPRLRFPGFADSWEKKILGDVFYPISSGKSRKSEEGSYLFYGSTGLIGTSSTFEYSGTKILVARVGANAGYLYKVDGEFSVSDNTLIINDTEDANLDFLYFRLTKYNLNKLVFGSGQPLITGGQLSKIEILFPSISEQEKISTFIRNCNGRSEYLLKKKALLEKYKKGMMQKIFNQEIRFKDEDGKDFGEWKLNYLGELSTISKGQQLNADNLTEMGTYPCINGGISASGYTTMYNSEDSITISEGGNSCGFVNFWKDKFWSGGHCYTLKVVEEKINACLLFQLLKYNEKQIMNLRVGSGLPNIQKGAITSFPLVFPESLKEQSKISNFLSAIDDKINLVAREIDQMEVWKKGLLGEMFV